MRMGRDQVFTVNLHHDGIFSPSPLKYIQGDEKHIIDINFEGMSYVQFRDITRHLVHEIVYKIYYYPLKTPLNVKEFLRLGYEQKWYIDLYVEHFDYDVLDFVNEEANGVISSGSSDKYYSSDECEEIEGVDFHTEGEKNVRSLLVYCGRSVEGESSRPAKSAKTDESTSKFAKSVKTDASTSKTPKIKSQIREKFLIDVSIGQCRRAKQMALYNHEGGLDVEDCISGNTYFRRFYICFKGVKDGWLEGCRRIISLDGCFLKHTCRGELLIAMGRDANNQMYPIAWVVVKINLDIRLTQEHRKCTRYVFANFKRKFSGVQLTKLFWKSASSTIEQIFYSNMEEMKFFNLEAYEYLIQRNPNSWFRAFFNLDVKCHAFKNGISKMMNKMATNLEEEITPTVRKKLAFLKEAQRHWIVYLSAYNKLEVRCGDQAFGEKLRGKMCLQVMAAKWCAFLSHPDNGRNSRMQHNDQS
ncbi:hypothetical protein Tco_0001935 [Tanacetum coccineum]